MTSSYVHSYLLNSTTDQLYRGSKGTLWEGGTRAVTFLHSPLLDSDSQGSVKDGLFHIVDWTPTIAAMAGVDQEHLDTMGLDGVNQIQFLLEDQESARTEFVYNIKTAPFKVGLIIQPFLFHVITFFRLVTDMGSTSYFGGIIAKVVGLEKNSPGEITEN